MRYFQSIETGEIFGCDPNDTSAFESFMYGFHEVDAPVNVVSQIPKSITKIQAMRQLKILNLWDAFKAILATNEDARDEWELALSLERDNNFVINLSSVLNLTSDQLDTLFIEAGKL